MPASLPRPTLLIDSASQEIVVGLQGIDDSPAVWSRRVDEAGTGIFAGLEDVLEASGVALKDVRSIAFCEGPGSILGIRIAAMAIRSWTATGGGSMPVFAYNSLALLATDLLDEGIKPGFLVATDARRSFWNVLEVRLDGGLAPVQRVPGPELERRPGALFHPAGFAHWQPFPDRTEEVTYRPERVFELGGRYSILRECAAPDALMTAVPEYRKAPTVPVAIAPP